MHNKKEWSDLARVIRESFLDGLTFKFPFSLVEETYNIFKT